MVPTLPRRPPGSTRLRGVGQAYRSGTPSL
jgi:hypothetical protein